MQLCSYIEIESSKLEFKYEILNFSQGKTLVQRLNIDFVNVLLNIFKVPTLKCLRYLKRRII